MPSCIPTELVIIVASVVAIVAFTGGMVIGRSWPRE